MVSPVSSQGSTQSLQNASSQQNVNNLNQTAQNTNAETEAQTGVRLAGHAAAITGKALDALDKTAI